MKMLLKAGRVIDPSQNFDSQMDIFIEEGKIASITDHMDGIS